MNNTQEAGRRAFGAASAGLVAAAAAHLLAYGGGAGWMAWLGAPPSIVASRAAGSWPALAGTLAIMGVLLLLAGACRVPVRNLPHRALLTATALLFVARGLLVLPYWAGVREWRTPLGRFVVSGDSFAAGSLVVLVLGLLVAGGLLASPRPRITSSPASP